jgi:hypothetical protein
MGGGAAMTTALIARGEGEMPGLARGFRFRRSGGGRMGWAMWMGLGVVGDLAGPGWKRCRDRK